jgi:hypothetical protein
VSVIAGAARGALNWPTTHVVNATKLLAINNSATPSTINGLRDAGGGGGEPCMR